MPFCPKCREEFRENFTVCLECNVALVETLENEADQVAELEVACNLTDEQVAHIIRGYLESEGIPCVLENVTFHAAPAPETGLTQARLWVQKTDAQAARNLIAEHEQFNICSACGHVAGADDTSCDFCGAEFKD